MTDLQLSVCPTCGNRFDPVLRDSCPLCSAGASTEEEMLQIEEPAARAPRDSPPAVEAPGRRRSLPLGAIAVLSAAALVGALTCLALLNWSAGSDGLFSLELAKPPPPEVTALDADGPSEPLAGVLRLDSLEIEAGSGERSVARITLTNLTRGTVRELAVQLSGIDSRGRPVRTPPEQLPTIVGGGRSVTVEVEVPAGTTVRSVVAQQWTHRTESLSVADLRARERSAAEGRAPADSAPGAVLGLE